MLLAACEGLRWRYEICEHADGYLVQMREVESGELDGFATLFRTMPVALAFAEMSAAFERFVSGSGRDEEDGSAHDAVAREKAFVALSDRLDDAGENAHAARARAGRGPRRTLH